MSLATQPNMTGNSTFRSLQGALCSCFHPILLNVKSSFVLFHSSVYCFGHFWCLIAILFMNAGKTNKQQKEEEKAGEIGEEKSTTKYEDFTELRNKVNRKLTLLMENLTWGLRMR